MHRHPLRALDDFIFRIEETILWTFLAAMTIMVFLDVVYRRLADPSSKVAELIVRVFSVEDPDMIARVSSTIAPVVSAVVGFGLLWFGFWTTERHRNDGQPISKTRPIVRAVLSGILLWGAGRLMTAPGFSSKYFYLLLAVIVAAASIVSLVRHKPHGWMVRVASVVVACALFSLVALKYFPYGYSWSKELSLILLLWVGFLGASVCAHEGKHIQMEALQRVVPKRIQPFVHAAGFLFTAAFCGFASDGSVLCMCAKR
ncbi:MAG: TRAP transporter small permease subunit [Polyangiales bacterium]